MESNDKKPRKPRTPRKPKTRLTKVEKFYINAHKDIKSVAEMAVEMNIPAVLIEKEIGIAIKAEKKEEKVANSEPATLKAGDLLGRNTRYGAVVMTKQASELQDEVKKNAAQKRQEKFIHKFK